MSPNAIPNELIDAAIETLDQGEILLGEISDEVYTRTVPAVFNATIGGHYRHCLDHFQRLVEATQSGDLNYDHRSRGTPVEHDRFAALNATRTLRDAVLAMTAIPLGHQVVVTSKTRYASAGSQAAVSSVGREIMYAVAHAVHHYALIGVMCHLMNVSPPPGFGVAPSTLQHQRESARV